MIVSPKSINRVLNLFILYRCVTCIEGSYSLANPYSNNAKCVECDDKAAVCLGGAKIFPKPGYWRYDVNTSNIMKCPEFEACL